MTLPGTRSRSLPLWIAVGALIALVMLAVVAARARAIRDAVEGTAGGP